MTNALTGDSVLWQSPAGKFLFFIRNVVIKNNRDSIKFVLFLGIYFGIEVLYHKLANTTK